MMSLLQTRCAASRQSPYADIKAISEEATRSPAAFTGLLAAEPQLLSAGEHAKLQMKFALLRSWQETSLDLLAASVRGDIPSTAAAALLDHLPDHFGWQHHARVAFGTIKPPVFFRTDEAADGTILEVQCPGSGWGMHEILQEYYAHAGFECARTTRALSARFTKALHEHLGCPPVVQHLLDNSSNPAGERFFIQRARRGAAYFGFDDVRPQHCNFIRAHDFFGLLTENFAAERLRLLAEGKSVYDLPPVALFDQKALLAFPYWDDTRDYFNDQVRSLFPYTTIVTSRGLRLDSGDWATLEQFSQLPRSRRRYFLKYAGGDVARNWGSRAVFRLDTESRDKCLTRLRSAVQQYQAGERWIIQHDCPSDERISFISAAGEIEWMSGHSKHSTYYGPGGALGAKKVVERSFKVHMSKETVVTVNLVPNADSDDDRSYRR
jgi:hypothetical protein